MTLIDKEYQQQLNKMHKDGRFENGHKAYKIIEKFFEEYEPTDVMDFGCGKGALVASIKQLHPTVVAEGYDPGNPDFAKLPDRTFDAVVSTDAIEHIEPEYLDETLRMLGNKIQRCGFFRIACYPAKKNLPDGRNAHLVVQPPEWWRERILATMDVEIVWEKIKVVDESHTWPHVRGHNYDVVVLRKGKNF